MNNNVEEIKSRLNIVDVVGEYVRLTKAGSHWKGLCPFHHEKSPSFMVNEEKQIFHCFGCAKGGDVFTFVQEIESMEFREVLKMLAEKAGVQLEQYQSKESGSKKRVLEALELATKFYETQLWKGMGKEKILGYLNGRGINDDSIRQFRLGYAPNGWDNISKFLLERGFTMEEISQTGLLVKKENGSGSYDRFRDRIMFPIQDIMGSVIGYSARVVPGADESQAKYINTPETLVYHKSKALYGISHAKNEIKQKNYVLLVEGNMDVIASHQAGLRNTVAVSGTALTSDQITILKRYTENMAMLFDMDSAGQLAAQKSADLCFENGMQVKIVTLSEGKDAADVVQKDPQKLVAAVESSVSAMDFFFQAILKKYDKTSAQGKQQIAREVLSHVSHAASPIEKAHWVKKLAHELDVEEKVIADVLLSVSPANQQRFDRGQIQLASKDQSSFQKRSDVIRDSLVGLIMSDRSVWQEIAEREIDNAWVQDDAMIRFVLSKGSENGFSFDNLLSGIENEQARERLRRIYFASKYTFTQDSVMEPTPEELRVLIDSHINQYAKELQKQRLHAIIKEIKSAEQAGNKEALTNLMGEFAKLSQELN
ncbi:MAG TPA: DNA primase [Patescibacteria group bacterium]